MPIRKIDIDPDDLRNIYISDQQLANKLGCTKSAISNRRTTEGIYRTKLIRERVDEIIHAFTVEGKTWQQIRDVYNAPGYLIPQILNEHGLRPYSGKQGTRKTGRKQGRPVTGSTWDNPDQLPREDYRAALETEIEQTAKLLRVSADKYRKWVDETPEGQWYFEYVQGLEGVRWEVDLETGEVKRIGRRGE